MSLPPGELLILGFGGAAAFGRFDASQGPCSSELPNVK
jgi:hypothetical protein